MATRVPATARIQGRSGVSPHHPWIGVCAFALFVLTAAPALAQSNNVRLTKLSDVPFGTITNFASDSVSSQSVCAFSASATKNYHVTASGSGTGGAFSLASGSSSLAYDVQWNGASGQTSGTQLSPNVALTGLLSAATQQACNSGPATSGSLIVILRSSAVSSARTGSYSGTLTLVIGPE